MTAITLASGGGTKLILVSKKVFLGQPTYYWHPDSFTLEVSPALATIQMYDCLQYLVKRRLKSTSVCTEMNLYWEN